MHNPVELRSVTRAHVIAWRKDMEARKRSPASIRRRLSALSAPFDYLCERNAFCGNPVDGVKRPMANGNEGTTPALGDAQARKLLGAPPEDTLKGVRDRASATARSSSKRWTRQAPGRCVDRAQYDGAVRLGQILRGPTGQRLALSRRRFARRERLNSGSEE
jgi:hypothetical protein